jgi:isocitrate dehydrogenase kinase/phosphatase
MLHEAPAQVDEIAQQIAEITIAGFDRHYRVFRATSASAKQLFEQARFAEMQQAVKERIRFYDERVRECVERLNEELDAGSLDDETWRRAKLLYIGLLVDHKRPELAETFFNSVVTRVLQRTYVHNGFAFVRAAISTEYIESDPPNYRSYHPGAKSLRGCLREVFTDFEWSLPFADLDRDVDYVLRAILERREGEWPAREVNFQVQVLGSAFYRNKAAHVIGKFVNGNDETPFVVPVLHDGDGRLYLDTILLERGSISVLFSLSRAYFMADMDVPSGYVQFLQSLMPAKLRGELYTAVGLAKQGKTLFVRDMLHHLLHSQDMFVEAPGTRGLVMHVFNLPSYPYVVKVIKDEFGHSKQSDRETVMRKFDMVKEIDRVGRMADTLEFKNLALPRDRFAPELLAELLALASKTVWIDGDNVIVGHCYVERRMTPINLYLETATPEEVEAVVKEYGDAIRDLAIANVFPGDMLWRNFGVNRHGRVEFYDYDEIEYLTDCTFREIPPPPNPEAEMSGEPWYPVAPLDVFPEEFETFLLGDPRVRDAFLRHHAELLRPEFWRHAQEQVARGEMVDFWPYPESMRFAVRYGDRS